MGWGYVSKLWGVSSDFTQTFVQSFATRLVKKITDNFKGDKKTKFSDSELTIVSDTVDQLRDCNPITLDIDKDSIGAICKKLR